MGLVRSYKSLLVYFDYDGLVIVFVILNEDDYFVFE